MNRSGFGTVLLAIVATAATYLFMHFVVAPRLSVVDVEVPPVIGVSPEQGRALLAPRGLLLVLDGEKSDERAQPGELVQQQPLAGSRVHRGTEIHVLVATTPPTPLVPAIVGMPLAQARDQLVKSRLRPGVVTSAPDEAAPKGTVIACSPEPGSTAKVDMQVNLMISAGADQSASVPSLIGKRLSKAKEMLQQVGLDVGSTHVGSNDDFAQGVVIKQTPAAGTAAIKGAKIDVVIND